MGKHEKKEGRNVTRVTREEIDREIKRYDRKSLFSPLSLIFIWWLLAIAAVPEVLLWVGLSGLMGGLFESVEWAGMNSLLLIIVVVAYLLFEKAHGPLDGVN